MCPTFFEHQGFRFISLMFQKYEAEIFKNSKNEMKFWKNQNQISKINVQNQIKNW